MVSAEILAENIKGMKIEEIKKLNKSDIDKFLGVEITSTRIGCELFPLEALKKIQ
jgi:NifU-like protein involved in Fe-S cluster formation